MTEKAGENMIEKEKPKKATDMEGVRLVAKGLLSTEIHDTEYAPLIISHPFASSGIVFLPGKTGREMLDITSSEENRMRWRKYLDKCIDQAASVFQICCMLNKPYRLAFLKYAQPHIEEKEFAQLLALCWMQTEAPNQDVNVSQKEFVEMFQEASAEDLMNLDEHRKLAELPDEIEIYRGVTEKNKDNILAMSWTMKQETAEWFANRFKGKGKVYRAKIRKEDILAVFLGRNESEVIVDPKNLKEISLCEPAITTDVETAEEDQYKEIANQEGVMQYDF